MRLRNRLGLVGFGVVIFLIITPILVLYARGFKIDFANRTFVKTGALVVRTQPTKAEIFVDDKKLESETPANVRFLIPADYNLRVEKQGYQSWTKRLSVRSQLVTWANADRDYITLFLSNPSQVSNIETKLNSISKFGDEIIYVSSNELGLINVNNSDRRTLLRVNDLKLPLSVNTEIRWNNSQQIFSLFATESNRSTLEANLNKIQHLETESGHIVLMINSDLFALESGKLILLEKAISNFSLDNSNIWYVQKNLLKQYNFSNNQYQIISSLLPISKSSKIIRTDNQIYLILDNTLYLVNDTLEKIYAPATDASWYKTSNTLLFNNDNEIYLYDADKKNSELIVRSLTAVKNPLLNKETGYIYYQNEAKIKAIELDDRDHRNIFTIADAADSFALSEDGKKLFVTTSNRIKEYLIR